MLILDQSYTEALLNCKVVSFNSCFIFDHCYILSI